MDQKIRREVDSMADCHEAYLRCGDGGTEWDVVVLGFTRETSHYIFPLLHRDPLDGRSQSTSPSLSSPTSHKILTRSLSLLATRAYYVPTRHS